MDCNDIRSRFTDYFDGALDESVENAVERHIAECTECGAEFASLQELYSRLGRIPEREPEQEMSERFYSMLGMYRNSRDGASGGTSTGMWPSFLRWKTHLATAAAVILVFGFTSGSVFERVRNNDREIDGIKTEMAAMRQLLTAALLTQDSAVERLRGISMSRELTDPDDRLVSALITSLNTDPDVNVRLAAVEAIQRYGDRDWVRTRLVDSMDYQSSPLVQIALIELYADIKDKQAIPVLEAVAGDETSMEPVKARARLAMERIM